ncbi:hypothetical protein DPEC_G00073960 [Dallia pectoralis]|uniref:Uncharacterized protein n=1 Tax=Dallia pectoralis TaxID=75939 RepID=A0ACC2H3J0_DALPE|nr:hypothetical protein DPEC_G00073960 [Dallia pectoralis]
MIRLFEVYLSEAFTPQLNMGPFRFQRSLEKNVGASECAPAPSLFNHKQRALRCDVRFIRHCIQVCILLLDPGCPKITPWLRARDYHNCHPASTHARLSVGQRHQLKGFVSSTGNSLLTHGETRFRGKLVEPPSRKPLHSVTKLTCAPLHPHHPPTPPPCGKDSQLLHGGLRPSLPEHGSHPKACSLVVSWASGPLPMPQYRDTWRYRTIVSHP